MQAPIFKNFEKSFLSPFRANPIGSIGVNLLHPMLERIGMKELSNRTAAFTDSVIRRMTRISNKYGAVNLSQGFPDFDPPAQLLDSLSTIATDPKPLYHQYSITWGSQAMREALATKQEHFMGMPINPNENIVVTCGSTEAMMAAMMTVTKPRRQGRHFLAVLRELRRRHDPLGR